METSSKYSYPKVEKRLNGKTKVEGQKLVYFSFMIVNASVQESLPNQIQSIAEWRDLTWITARVIETHAVAFICTTWQTLFTAVVSAVTASIFIHIVFQRFETNQQIFYCLPAREVTWNTDKSYLNTSLNCV